MAIAFNRPFITGTELTHVSQALQSGHTSGDGAYTKKINAFIESKFSAFKSLMTTSCTSALEMAALLIDLKEGDEVILPSYTFVSTANAIYLRGAKPVFVEIEEETLNMDLSRLEAAITSKTKAIFVVHYGGVSCDMDRLLGIAKKHQLKVVEDAAQAVNAKYKEAYLGTLGDIGCYSFHESKNYSSGEGGALLINGDLHLAQRAEIIREKGTNRSQFFRGEIDKYSWVDLGSSYLPSDVLAALLYAQFEQLDEILERRKDIFNAYSEGLKDLKDKGLLKMSQIPSYSQSNYHIFYILLGDESQRNDLMDFLKQRGISAVFHYLPLHTSDMGQKLGYVPGQLPLTESLSGRLLRLPLYPDLKDSEVKIIIEAIHDYFA